jgi:hypothetical protein
VVQFQVEKFGFMMIALGPKFKIAGLIVTGGEPTKDKPEVTFAPPKDLNRASHSITIRVPDCQQAYEILSKRGAEFLPPLSTGDMKLEPSFATLTGIFLKLAK